MKKLPLLFGLLLAWLTGLELFARGMDLGSLAFSSSAAAAVALVAVPALGRLHPAWIVSCAAALFAARFALGASLGQPSLVLALAEAGALAASIWVAREIARGLAEFKQTVARGMVHHLADHFAPFETGQNEIYREVHRARRYRRPLALLSIEPSSSAQVAIPRLLEQVQRETLRRYVVAQVADLLAGEMDDSDIVTHRDEQFVVLLPELGPEEAMLAAKRLCEAAEERLGFGLRIGVATFPDEEVTFEKLLERAEAEMRRAASTDDDREAWRAAVGVAR